jgi:stage V sporulation protein B
LTDNKGQNYLHGAAILAAGVVIMKILGAIYKIPMGNILGDEGFAHFNVAYNIYNVLLILSTAGLPVALSRMISEASALNRPIQVKRCFKVALAAFAVLGTLGSLIMFLFPMELASLMNDVEASQSILAMSPAVLLVCLASAYRGYAQGHSDMKPTTVSQVVEVAVKVFVGLALAWTLSSMGKSLPICSAGAIFGVTAGSLVSLIYMFFQKRRVDINNQKPISSPDIPDRSDVVLKNLLKIGIPIALGSSVMADRKSVV